MGMPKAARTHCVGFIQMQNPVQKQSEMPTVFSKSTVLLWVCQTFWAVKKYRDILICSMKIISISVYRLQ